MEDFLNKLYSYENFSLYLIIAIVVLVLLFIVILFVGKKDKKEREIETTKKLEQINSEDIGTTFKMEDNEIPLEVKNENIHNDVVDTPIISEPNEEEKDNSLENDTIIIPTIDSFSEIQNENFELDKTVSFEVINNNDLKASEPSIDVPFVENNVDTNKEEVKEEINGPVLDQIEEKPIVFESDLNFPSKEDNEKTSMSFEDLVNTLSDEKEEETTNSFIEPEIKTPEIFSSVYTPTQEEPTVPTKEDLDIELPALKKEEEPEVKEEEIEKPVLTDYNLDELSGETYTIDK